MIISLLTAQVLCEAVGLITELVGMSQLKCTGTAGPG